MTIKKRRSRYQLGGRPLNIPGSNLQVGGRGKKMLPRKLQTGGTGGSMYADNTVQAAGQGGAGTTSNIVFQESNPALQEQRVKGLQNEQERLKAEAANTSTEVERIQEEGEAKAEFEGEKAKATYGAQAESIAGTAKSLYDVGAQSGAFKPTKSQETSTALGVKDSYNLTKAANAGNKITQAGIQGAQGTKLALDAAKSGGQVMSSAATGKTIIVDGGGNLVKGGSAIGSGLKSFATSGAGLGMIGSLAGAGISKLSDDGDPTKSNFGEYSGAVLSGAGAGAGWGSMLGPVGTGVGAVVGGLYGAGKQFFGTKAAKRAKKKAERVFKQKQNKLITKSNKDLMKSYGSQMSQVHAGNLAQKTYSGYDLGRNVVARRGGYRTMPKYI